MNFNSFVFIWIYKLLIMLFIRSAFVKSFRKKAKTTRPSALASLPAGRDGL